jgi:lipid II isoglutaminyl synthase (glutamine-hydrolysing)
MPDVSLLAALVLGKGAGLLSRSLRLGGGTTLPGSLARRLAPAILRDLAAALPEGVVLVSGTNGKTTTTRMIAEILRTAGREVLHNRAGANLVSGLTATALADADWRGRPRSRLGLFETDEAALSQALAETVPRLVLIHNLFRDQLDRYGEVDTVAAAWRTALANLPAGSRVLLNADDPAVAELGQGLAACVEYYGLQDRRHAVGGLVQSADSQFCRRCGSRYEYAVLFYAHIGHYRCPNCGHCRPEPQYRLEQLELQGSSGSRLLCSYPGGGLELRLPLPGLYNALNALAALAAGLSLDLTPQQIRAGLEDFNAAFGRIERVQAGPGGPPMLIALIKNPVGASETLRMLGSSEPAGTPLHLLIAINDRFADGTDVSWLWDADFEQLAVLPVARYTLAGTRAADMAVRLKYAGIDPANIDVVPELGPAVDAALQQLPSGATLYVVPTYTAMLELRSALSRRGWVRPFWDT